MKEGNIEHMRSIILKYKKIIYPEYSRAISRKNLRWLKSKFVRKISVYSPPLPLERLQGTPWLHQHGFSVTYAEGAPHVSRHVLVTGVASCSGRSQLDT